MEAAGSIIQKVINKCSRNFFNTYIEEKSRYYAAFNTIGALNHCVKYKDVHALSQPITEDNPEPVNYSNINRKTLVRIMQVALIFPLNG